MSQKNPELSAPAKFTDRLSLPYESQYSEFPIQEGKNAILESALFKRKDLAGHEISKRYVLLRLIDSPPNKEELSLLLQLNSTVRPQDPDLTALTIHGILGFSGIQGPIMNSGFDALKFLNSLALDVSAPQHVYDSFEFHGALKLNLTNPKFNLLFLDNANLYVRPASDAVANSRDYLFAHHKFSTVSHLVIPSVTDTDFPFIDVSDISGGELFLEELLIRFNKIANGNPHEVSGSNIEATRRKVMSFIRNGLGLGPLSGK